MGINIVLDVQGELAKTNMSPAIPDMTAGVDYGPLLLIWKVGTIIYSSRDGRMGYFQAPD